jgi:hypothetical protein
MSEDFEQLSRYRAGELTEREMRALEAQPAFSERLLQLERLDAAARGLSVDLEPRRLEALLAKVKRPEAPRGRAWKALGIGLAGLLVVAGVGLGLSSRAAAPAWQLMGVGEVTVDGKPVAGSARLAQGSTLRTAAGGTAQLLGADGWVGLSGGSAVSAPSARSGRGLRLLAGTATVSSQGIELSAQDTTVQVQGLAVLSMEPQEGVARVTEALEHLSPGDLMKTQWMRLSTVAMTAAAVGSALTLFVVEGHASVRQGDAAPVELRAGEQWKAFEPRPTPSRPAVAAAEPEPAKALVGEPPAANPQLAKLSRPELVAMVERLNVEKESLLAQRAALTQKLDAKEKPNGNYYRQSREELADLAGQGELRLRGPQLSGQETKISDAVKDALRLTPEEVAGAKAIFERSTERAHLGLLAFYKELGGDPSLASTLGSDALFNELRAKSLKGDWEEAVRRAANERAGLLPQEAGGTPVLKALRMLAGEDDRVLDELDALLGPSRAEQFLNHQDTAKHRHGFGVGPGQPR